MPKPKLVFGEYGPHHLTDVDWENPDHRRCVMASLTQGTKIIECDRQECREVPLALAPPWYESFHFELYRKISDPDDRCIFGAIFQHKSPTSNSIPKFVIAFRGTMVTWQTALNDCSMDTKVLLNGLHENKCFQQAVKIIKETVALAGAANVWLTGHSLGAAIALLAGKEMARSDQPHLLETYVFNPPFVSFSLEKMKSGKLKEGISIARTFLRGTILVTKSVVASFVTDGDGGGCSSQQFDDPFAAISGWVPHLFVHRGDYICSGYINYFKNRQNMRNKGLGRVERFASQESTIRNIFSRTKIEPEHLLASAKLNINSSPSTNLKSDHSHRHWWAPNLVCETKIYRFE